MAKVNYYLTKPQGRQTVNRDRRSLLKATGAGALLGLSACSTWGSPEELAVRQIEPLRDYVRERIRIEDIPGAAVVVATKERVIHAEGFGVTRAGTTESVNADTVFQIGSTTKAFLAATLAMAVDDGALGWDEPLAHLEPAFRLSDASRTERVTPADVLAHATGLSAYVYDTMWILGYPLESRLRALANVPLTAGYRDKAQYVNNLHTVVGRAIARRAGATSWEAYVQQRLLNPLGMLRSSVTQAGLYGATGHAWGHQHIDGRLKALSEVGSYWYEAGAGPAGSINSTANDLGRWLRFQLGRGEIDGRRLISTSGIQRTWQPLIPNKDGGSALGWGVLELPQGRLISHDGGTAAFGSNVMLLPEHGIGIAVLTNHAQEGLPFAISRWFAGYVLGESVSDLRAGFSRPAPAPQLATVALSRPASAYEGQFDSPSLGRATIKALGVNLTLTLLEVGAVLRLRPVRGPDHFLAEVLPQGRFSEVVVEGFNPFFAVDFRFSSNATLIEVAINGAGNSGYEVHQLQVM